MNDLILWSPGIKIEQIEKQVIQKAYAHYKYNKTATANSLGISIRTLDSRLEQYNKDAQAELERQKRESDKRTEMLARARGLVPDNLIGARTEAVAPPQNTLVNHAVAGARMESVIGITTQQAMPMPERQEVQAVLPTDSPKGSPKRAR